MLSWKNLNSNVFGYNASCMTKKANEDKLSSQYDDSIHRQASIDRSGYSVEYIAFVFIFFIEEAFIFDCLK